jgi:hypothetical protein
MDFSTFTSQPAQTGPTWDNKGTYTVDPGGEAKLVEMLMKLHFPEAYQFSGARLSAKSPSPGAEASTGGLQPLGEVRVGTNFFRPSTTYSSGEVKGLETPEILSKLATLLHEAYHTRSAHVPGVGRKILPGKELPVLLDNAKTAGFPSVDKHVFNGDNLEEFLATAVPLTEWGKTSIGPAAGRWGRVQRNLEAMKRAHPGLEAYIEENSRPEVLPTVLKRR